MTKTGPKPTDPLLRFERFFDRNTDGCWLWKGGTAGKYGVFFLDGNQEYAHRAAYRLFRGPIPNGLLIRHTCDTPLCVRPDHLLTGTHKDNARDMLERGRAWVWTQPERLARGERNGMRTKPENHRVLRGEDNANAKLTEAAVREIVRRANDGEKQITLAREFGVGPMQVSRIVRGERWSHVTTGKEVPA